MSEQGTRRPFFEEMTHLRATNANLLAALEGLLPLLVREEWDAKNPKVRYLRCIDPICGAIVTRSKMTTVGLRHTESCRAECTRATIKEAKEGA